MLELKPAAALDVAALAELFNAAYAGYWYPVQLDEGSFARMVELADGDLTVSRIAVEDGEPVAIVLVARRGESGWVGGMGVVAPRRRQGIGQVTLNAALDASRDAGIEEISLEVLGQNTAARALYGRLGFEVVRELEVWHVPGAPAPAVLPTPGPSGEAHAWIQGRRAAREPGQRADGSLAHVEDAVGLANEGAAAVVRLAAGVVQILQLGGDPDALRILIARASMLGPVRVLNLPADDPARPALEALGGRVEATQYEMALRL